MGARPHATRNKLCVVVRGSGCANILGKTERLVRLALVKVARCKVVERLG